MHNKSVFFPHQEPRSHFACGAVPPSSRRPADMEVVVAGGVDRLTGEVIGII